MSENKISYFQDKETNYLTNITVNGQKISDCSLNDLPRAVVEELKRQEKGEIK